MSDRFSSVVFYLQHRLRARHRGGHGIHSPFVYEFVRQVIYTQEQHADDQRIRSIYSGLLRSDRIVRVEEMGARSQQFRRPERRISQMARHSSVKLKSARIVYRIASYCQPAVTIELGTSIGFSALCLGLGNPAGKVISIEGNKSLCDFAEQLFREKGIPNIEVVQSGFDDCLPKLPDADLIFIDGNHDYEPTLQYFNHFAAKMQQGILIFDDIHWSVNMHRAWQKIVADKRCIVSIDLYQMGIVFLDTSITPGRYVIRV